MSTFNEDDHPRSAAGMFARKRLTVPEAELTSPSAAERADEAAANVHVDRWLSDLGHDGRLRPDGLPSREQMLEYLESTHAQEGDDDEEAYEAARLVSSMLADGQPGRLTDTFDLRPGDRVDLSRIVTEDRYRPVEAEFARQDFGVVARTTNTDDGETWIDIGNGPGRLSVPVATGTALPVQTVRLHGKEMTENEAVTQLIRDGAVDASSHRLLPHDVLADYAQRAGLAPGDASYPELVS